MAAAMGLTHEQQLQEGQQGGQEGKKASTHSPPHFVCQLTFAAAGDNFGDIVQVTLVI